MARPLRIEYPGAIYHIMARGNERRAIFRSDSDLTQIKAYVREKDGTNHTVVPDGNACKWEVDVGDYLYAGHGESLSMHTSDVA